MNRREFLALLRESREWRGGHSYFYNLRVGRNGAQVARELRAMASTKPLTIELVEALGYDLPKLDGYKLLRDTSTRGRANVAAYARDDYPVKGPWWIQCHETWDRPKGPGRHWPREHMVYTFGRMQRIVGHVPPRYGNDNAYASQRESIVKIADRMAPWRNNEGHWRQTSRTGRLYNRLRPRAATCDFNRTKGEINGPSMLAHLIGGKAHGERIDATVVRNVRVQSIRAVSSVKRVALRSDHGHAMRIAWTVRAPWLPKKK